MIKCINNFSVNDKKSPFVSFSAKRFPNKLAQEFKQTLLNAESTVIACHENNDHDSLNAARAMARWVRGHGKKVDIYAEPESLVQLTLPSDRFDLTRGIARPDLLMLVDHNGTDRMSKKTLELLKYNPKLIIMDHHRPTQYTLPNALTYIDETSRSCCGIVYRWMRALGEKIDSRTARKLTLGAASDMRQSELIRFDRSRIVGMPALTREPEAREILEDLAIRANREDIDEIGRHLDVLGNLTPTERELQQQLFREVRTTQDGRLAYVVINPKDEQWLALGCKTERTSEILRDLCKRLMQTTANDNNFTPAQRRELARINGAAIFYPTDGGDVYRVSLHGKQALDVLQDAKGIYKGITGQKLIGDGRPNRAGGRINTCSPQEIGHFIQSIKQAAAMAS